MSHKRLTKKDKIARDKRLEMISIKKKELENMKIQLSSIESELKDVQIKNMKLRGIRNLKIFGNVLNASIPYVVTACVFVGGIRLLGGGWPFVLDSFPNYNYTQMELDSLGNQSSIVRYERGIDLPDNKVTVFSPWEMDEDGMYKRTIYNYAYSKTEADVLSMIKNVDVDAFVDVFKDSGEIVYETSKELPSDDTDYFQYFISGNIYSINKEDFEIVQESVGFNVGMTCIFLLGTFLIGGVSYSMREYDLSYHIRRSRNEFRLISTDNIKKKLVLTQNKISDFQNEMSGIL